MHNTWVIAKREFRSYFDSPVAYIVICLVLVAIGLIFFVLQAFFTAGRASVRDLLSSISIMLMFFAPAAAMKLVAEERRTGTLELLITMPVRDREVVGGKYLAAVGLLAVLLLVTLGYPIVLFGIARIGALDWGPVMGGYLGLLLEGGAFLAIGLFASTLSDSQLLSFILATFVCAVFYFLDNALMFVPDALAGIAEYVSFDYHFANLARGVIDSRDVLFFLSVIAVALLGAFRMLERRRWA